MWMWLRFSRGSLWGGREGGGGLPICLPLEKLYVWVTGFDGAKAWH